MSVFLPFPKQMTGKEMKVNAVAERVLPEKRNKGNKINEENKKTSSLSRGD